MVEDNVKVMNDLDIQIKDLEDEIIEAKSINEKIKLTIREKLLILQQLDTTLNIQEA